MNQRELKVGVTNKEGQLGLIFSRGGLREGAGRKGIGMTKKVSLTLTEELWKRMEQHCADHKQSRSEGIRHIIEAFFAKSSRAQE